MSSLSFARKSAGRTQKTEQVQNWKRASRASGRDASSACAGRRVKRDSSLKFRATEGRGSVDTVGIDVCIMPRYVILS